MLLVLVFVDHTLALIGLSHSINGREVSLGCCGSGRVVFWRSPMYDLLFVDDALLLLSGFLAGVCIFLALCLIGCFLFGRMVYGSCGSGVFFVCLVMSCTFPIVCVVVWRWRHLSSYLVC